jgi:hypothetical protein
MPYAPPPKKQVTKKIGFIEEKESSDGESTSKQEESRDDIFVPIKPSSKGSNFNSK